MNNENENNEIVLKNESPSDESRPIYVIIKTTNLLTGQKYIGYHQIKNENDKYLGSGKYLLEDIKIYGRSSFEREIIAAYILKEDALNIETMLVTPEICESKDYYNILIGGKFVKGVTKLPEYWKNNLRKPKSEEHKAKLRKPKPDRHRINVSKARTGKALYNNGIINKLLSVQEFEEKYKELGFVKGKIQPS